MMLKEERRKQHVQAEVEQYEDRRKRFWRQRDLAGAGCPSFPFWVWTILVANNKFGRRFLLPINSRYGPVLETLPFTNEPRAQRTKQVDGLVSKGQSPCHKWLRISVLPWF